MGLALSFRNFPLDPIRQGPDLHPGLKWINRKWKGKKWHS